MSIVSMKKMSLVAHKGDRSRLMRLFVKAGCVELSETPLLESTAYPTDLSKRDTLESKRLKVSFALNFLKESLKEETLIDKKNAPKASFKKDNRLVPLEEYESTAREEVEIFSRIAEMEKINSRMVDIKGEKSRYQSLKEQLLPYAELDVPFADLKDTATCSVFVGTVGENAEEALTKLTEKAVLKTYGMDKSKCIVLVAHTSVKKEVSDVLSDAEFVRCPFDYDVTAATKIAELEGKIVALDEERRAKIGEAIKYLPHLTTFKVLYDYYTLEIAKFDAMQKCPRTKTAFVMEGWVPADRVEKLEAEVKETCKRTEIYFRDPFDNEIPPTAVKNVKPVQAFEGITDMFGAPSYREGDPNLFVALFYFLFFGIMISDAGYGLIMAIACFAFLAIKKPVKKSGQMMMMFGFCGISTLIWGALFGGWFAISIPEGSFLSKLTWFNPLDEPLKMFMLALGMGVLQIATGFALKGVALCKAGHPVNAIFNQFSWVIILIGLCLISPKLMVFLSVISPDPVPAWFATCSKIGMYVAIAGFVMLVIGGAIGKKNPIKMVTGAFGNVYGAINVVSDLLSYSRLFGLGLTTGVIGYVINMLADIIVNTFFHGSWIGWIPAAIVLVIGHVFNIAINLLGAYVHNSRLQYIEFFGRFYEGSGRAFKPLGDTTKYTYIDN